MHGGMVGENMMAGNTVWYHCPGAFSSLGTRVLPTEPSVLLVQIATPWKRTNNVIVLLCKLSQVFRFSGNVLGPPKLAVHILRMADLRETFFYCILGNYFFIWYGISFRDLNHVNVRTSFLNLLYVILSFIILVYSSLSFKSENNSLVSFFFPHYTDSIFCTTSFGIYSLQWRF